MTYILDYCGFMFYFYINIQIQFDKNIHQHVSLGDCLAHNNIFYKIFFLLMSFGTVSLIQDGDR